MAGIFGIESRAALSAIFVFVGYLAAASDANAAGEGAFDLDHTLRSVVRINSRIPDDARTAKGLGSERAGNGVVIDGAGLVLTIGYLILEATEVALTDADGRKVAAEIIAYDHETGFGLLRALKELGVEPMRFGRSDGLAKGDPVLIASHGGRGQTVGAFVVSRREFAGYWEYLLESAIFTSPPHPNWGGSALIGPDGRLLGVGSLLVADAIQGPQGLPGNMFVPIDILKPILAELLNDSGADRPRRPWLGMFTALTEDRIVVTRVSPEGPAQRAGIRPGDAILAVAGKRATDVADLYRKVWALGNAGVEVPLTIGRGESVRDLKVRSGNRYDYLKITRDH